MAASTSRRCASLSKLWSADDTGAVWRTGVALGRANRHAARHERAGPAGPGALGRDPHAGDLYVFRGVRGNLIKILWHDGIGMSLYAKRLEKGRFIWPSPTAGVVGISASQLAYMLDGIDWRNPVHTFRPERAG
jgi:transposase